MKNLRVFSLQNTGVTDISFVAEMANLTSVDFHATPLTDLSPLEGMEKLNSVNLAQTDVTDLSFATKLPNLRTLYLDKSKVSDLAPLIGVKKLRSLSLREVEGLDEVQVKALEDQGIRVQR